MLTKETIESILKIAIDNGFKEYNINKNSRLEIIFDELNLCREDENEYDTMKGTYIRYVYTDVGCNYVNLIELITSKEFIDSIVLYLLKTKKFFMKETDTLNEEYVSNWYIRKQAQCIYDGTLEEYFKSIIE